MGFTDYSTPRLKRAYVRHLKGAWRLQKYRQDGFSRDVGISREYWEHRDAARTIRDILVERSLDMP